MLLKPISFLKKAAAGGGGLANLADAVGALVAYDPDAAGGWTTSAGDVTALNDLVGSYDMTGSTNDPAESTFNTSYNAVEFVSNEGMAAGSALSTTARTMVVAFVPTDLVASNEEIVGNGTFGSERWTLRQNNATVTGQVGDQSWTTGNVLTADTLCVAAISISGTNASGLDAALYVDDPDTPTNSTASATAGATWGTDLAIGMRPNISQYWNGKIVGVLISSTELSGTDLSDVFDFFEDRAV